MHTLKNSLWLVIFLFILQTSAFADNPLIKLGRGIENIATSPVEYPLQYDMLNKQGKSVAVTAVAGTLQGTFWTAFRMVGGAVETLTFFLPIPDHYAPLLHPETPLQSLRVHGYFDEKAV